MGGRTRSRDILDTLRTKAEQLVRRQDKQQCLCKGEAIDTAPVGFVTLTPNGMIEYANATAARLLCHPNQFLWGQAFHLLLHPGDRRKFNAYLDKLAPNELNAPVDLRLKPRQNITVHFQVHGNVRFDERRRHQKYCLVLVDVTERKHYEDALSTARDTLEMRVRERTAELEQRMRQLARLSSELTLAEQRERRRLAEVLHDNLQQLLAGARYNLDMIGQAHGLLEQQNFKDMAVLLMHAIQTARSLAAELSPPVLYLQGLSGALEWLARWMRQTHNLEVTVLADPAADPVREDLKVLLFQSIRELLFNVVKHAGVRQARVRMSRRDLCTRIEVSDAGNGFDSEALRQRGPAVDGGFGLFTIRERLDLMGGRFDIASSVRGGTTAAIELPLETAAAEGYEESATEELSVAESGARERAEIDKIRILLVDDHAMMRKGLSMILTAQNDMEIAGEAADGRQAVEMAREMRPDVILMDINMPVMNGLEATRQICAEMPEVCVIGLSMHEAEDQARAMRAAGAVDYFSKSCGSGALLQAIRNSTCASPNRITSTVHSPPY